MEKKMTFRREKSHFKRFWWLFLAMCLLLVSPVLAVDISSCQNISSAGTYNLINDIDVDTDGSNPYVTTACIYIEADYVHLIGNGYKITGNTTSIPIQLKTGSTDHVIVENFVIDGGGEVAGIYSGGGGAGVYNFNVTIRHNIVNNTDGASSSCIVYHQDHKLINNTVYDCGVYGFRDVEAQFDTTDSVSMINNTVYGDTNTGLTSVQPFFWTFEGNNFSVINAIGGHLPARTVIRDNYFSTTNFTAEAFTLASWGNVAGHNITLINNTFNLNGSLVFGTRFNANIGDIHYFDSNTLLLNDTIILREISGSPTSTHYFYNVSIDDDITLVQESFDFVHQLWYLDVKVNDSGGNNVNLSNVTISNVTQDIVDSGLTNSLGNSKQFRLIDFIMDSGSVRTYNTPHNVTVFPDVFYSPKETEVNMTNLKSEAITITLDAFTENEASFTTPILEGTIDTFTINITAPTGLRISSGTLYYNDTAYVGTINNTAGNNYTITRSLTTPSVSADTNFTFYWNVVLEGGATFNNTEQNQTVQNMDIDDCSVHSFLILNFTIYDEELQTLIPETDAYNLSVEIDLDLNTVGSDSAVIEFSGNYSKNNNPQVCLAGELGTSTYELDATVKYGSDQHATEYYNIRSDTFTNDSAPQNINLYDLDDTNAQEFKITFKDASFVAVSDVLLQIQRKYLKEGVFKVVEIPITDSLGETIAHLKLDDAIYTIIAIKDGETLATFSNKRAICQNPSIDTCEINLNPYSSSLSPDDYTVGDDFVYTLTFDKPTREIESVFSIPSGLASDVTLNVTLFDGLGSVQACSDTLTSSAGTINCIIPSSFGNGTVVAKLFKDSNVVGNAMISLEQEPEDLYGASIVFLGLLLMLTMIGLGTVDSPLIQGIFLILGLILLISLNLIDTGLSSFVGAGATFLWFVVAIGIILIKGVKRQ